MNGHHIDNNQKPGNRLPWARLLLATGVILISLSCLGAMGGMAYYWAENAGITSTWQALGAPTEKGVDLVTGDLDLIYVRSANDRLYGCEHGGIRDPDSCWAEASEPLAVDPQVEFDNPLFQGSLAPPRGTVVDELDVTLWYADSAFETRYVLLEDGTVWKWEYDKGSGSLFACILGPLVGAAAGLLVAAALWIFVGRRGFQ